MTQIPAESSAWERVKHATNEDDSLTVFPEAHRHEEYTEYTARRRARRGERAGAQKAAAHKPADPPHHLGEREDGAGTEKTQTFFERS